MGRKRLESQPPRGKAEEDEFTRFFEAEFPSLVARLARGMLGDSMAAEDEAQVVLLKAYDQWSALAPEKRGAWLQKVSTNQLRDYIRKQRLRRHESLNLQMQDSHFDVPDPYNEFTHLEEEEGYVALIAIINQLPGQPGLALKARHIDEVGGTAKIAAVLGTRPLSVKTHEYRGRAMLRALLAQNPDYADWIRRHNLGQVPDSHAATEEPLPFHVPSEPDTFSA